MKKSKKTPFVLFAVLLAASLLTNLPKSAPTYNTWYGLLVLGLAWGGYAYYAIRVFNKN